MPFISKKKLDFIINRLNDASKCATYETFENKDLLVQGLKAPTVSVQALTKAYNQTWIQLPIDSIVGYLKAVRDNDDHFIKQWEAIWESFVS